MSKLPGIKWRAADVQKLQRTVKNFNAKITRELKRNPAAAAYLPEKVSAKQLKNEIKSRKDFNREVKSLARFSRKDAAQPVASKTGNTVAKWTKREIAIKVNNVINAQRRMMKEQMGSLEVISEGKKQGVTVAQTKTERLHEFEPKPFNFDSIKPGMEWEKFVESVEKQAQAGYQNELHQLFKDNYVKGLKKVFGEEAELLIYRVDGMSTDDFMDLYFSNPDLDIGYMYGPAEYAEKLDTITAIFDENEG